MNKQPKTSLSSSSFLKKDGAATKSNSISIPSISLPKGGGALKGIDEKFSVNAANGTFSFQVPFPLSPSRGGFQPSLSLGYNSGSGNGIFGLGWSMFISSIQRKTDKKLPRYLDETESDVFMLSGSEDLVPSFEKNTVDEFTIKTYRPRIEGSFAKIERVQPNNGNPFYWKITTRENIVTFFGITPQHRIADPENPLHFFQWLPQISFDDKGNYFLYEFKEEDKKNITASLHEQNRLTSTSAFTNKYLKRVKYGNKTPYFPNHIIDPDDTASLYLPAIPPVTPNDFMFEVVFDYGEHTQNNYSENSAGWNARNDAFSNYKPGFEIRTYRRCERVLMFHHFAELNNGNPTLVRSLDFVYDNTDEVIYLSSIRQTGYSTGAKSLPPLSFEYQPLQWNSRIQQISREDLMNIPAGIGNEYQWADLYNEGIAGILSEQANAWYYKNNLGEGKFSGVQLVSPKPSFTGIENGMLKLIDLDANGKKQIVSYEPGNEGYFELTDDNDWLPFKSFQQLPNIDFNDPYTRLVDLNGDGKPELLVTEDQAFRWYPSLGTAGYDSSELVPKDFDEEKGPAIVFADKTQSIFLADMCGDGLTDIVRINNEGAVCYWPNLGYGRFGAKVNMGTISIADPVSFNPAYLQLADVSGTGATDIIYLGNNKWQVWINRSGNTFSGPYEIETFWQTTKPAQINIIDLLGNGTGCIVWSSSMPGNVNAPMQYIDLMSGRKPHVMITHKNGMGKTTAIEYKSSVQYYLQDKKAGRPWITKLPFPVQCVNKVEVIDEVTDLRFTTKYSYHHGHFDHEEREFRGFGRVDQIDTEEYEYLKNLGASNASDIRFHGPPLLTRTWFHTGAFIRHKKILDQFEKENWYNDAFFAGITIDEHKLPEAQLPEHMTTSEYVQAYRACKGMILRTEIFSLDNSADEKKPYSVSTHNCNVRMLQPMGTNLHAVFLVQESEAIIFNYERNIFDAHITHNLNLEIDEYGNVLKKIAAAYGRKATVADEAIDQLDTSLHRHGSFIKEAQTAEHIVYTETQVTTNSEEKVNGKNLHYYRLPVPWSVKTYELSGIVKLMPGYFSLNDFAQITQLRLIERIETRLLGYDLETPLDAGRHGALGMIYESYQLAFTPQLLNDLFNVNAQRVTNTEMTDAKYCHIDDDPTDANWWIRSGTIQYFDKTQNETRSTSQNRFYVPVQYTDPFGTTTRVTYPANNYFLFIEKTIDALNNSTSVIDFDYRVLAPSKMMDINDNILAASFDALGLVVGMAVMGKGNQADDLMNFNADPNDAEITAFFNDPFSNGRDLLQHATTRIVYDFNSIPCRAATIKREMHVRKYDGTPNHESKLQFSFEYTDGMGNLVLKKMQAKNAQWIGSGRTILNNKGKPVKQYEPYFSITHLYDAEPALRQYGVTPVLHYDAAGRLIRTDYPDGSISRVEFDNWQQKIFDRNDTINEGTWDIANNQEAFEKSSIHANTPWVLLIDSLGRHFYTIGHNKWQFKNATDPQPLPVEEFAVTRAVLDIEGNVREVIDARDNIVIKYEFDMLGHSAHQVSSDAGERWLLNDCTGKPRWMWDNKNQRFENGYDILHRPAYSKLLKNNQSIVFEKTEYGTDKVRNLNGVPVTHFDTAGVVRITDADFNGKIRSITRQLCDKTTEVPDWNDLSAEIFLSTNEFDALGRIIEIVSPHTLAMVPSTTKQVYNETNLLEQVLVSIGQGAAKSYISNIDYDAKGQRTQIDYGNNSFTKYEYDAHTFRLKKLITYFSTNGILQLLNYSYDPVGNITNIKDEAQQNYFFNNSVVKPENNFQYDALYRLIEAKGREHIGQNVPANAYDRNRMFNVNIPASGNAVRNYTQRYTYDLAGNMKELSHIVKNISGSTGWTRTFDIASNNNQLLSVSTGSVTEQFSYDVHGNILKLAHLPLIDWNFRDQLQHLQIQAGADNDNADGAYYLYDGTGQRTRKIITKGNITEERIYLNGFEIFRKKQNGSIIVERESLHIMDDKSRIAVVETLTVETSTTLTVPETLTRYQLSNHHGSACLELDDIAQIISYEEYHPFGTTAYQNQNKNIKAAAKRYRYTSMERDEESGMEYHTARYYLPWLCRWASCDPGGISDGVNIYMYCHQSPVNGRDSTGNEDENEWVARVVLPWLQENNIPFKHEGRYNLSVKGRMDIIVGHGGKVTVEAKAFEGARQTWVQDINLPQMRGPKPATPSTLVSMPEISLKQADKFSPAHFDLHPGNFETEFKNFIKQQFPEKFPEITKEAKPPLLRRMGAVLGEVKISPSAMQKGKTIAKVAGVSAAVAGGVSEAAEPVVAWDTFAGYFESTRLGFSDARTNEKNLDNLRKNQQSVSVDGGRYLFNLKTGELSGLGNALEEGPIQANELGTIMYLNKWGSSNVFYKVDYNKDDMDDWVIYTLFPDPETKQWHLHSIPYNSPFAPPFAKVNRD